MENASKALIIAGAILLAILLISLGIMIFTQAQDVVRESGMTDAEIQTFNSKYIKYEGTVKGSEVKAMINEVMTSNANEDNTEKQITVNNSAPTGTSGVVSSKTYTITLEYTDGRVSNINYL